MDIFGGQKPTLEGIVAVVVIIILLLCAGWIECHASQNWDAQQWQQQQYEWEVYRSCMERNKQILLDIQRQQKRINSYNRNPNYKTQPSNPTLPYCEPPVYHNQAKKSYRKIRHGQ